MKAMIIDQKDFILSAENLPDGDFGFFGNGALTMTIMAPGVPYRLMLMENDGKVIAEGRFYKEIALNKAMHNIGDTITIKLSVG